MAAMNSISNLLFGGITKVFSLMRNRFTIKKNLEVASMVWYMVDENLSQYELSTLPLVSTIKLGGRQLFVYCPF
jgi:hypothetical protein